jgi:hypothetical protein
MKPKLSEIYWPLRLAYGLVPGGGWIKNDNASSLASHGHYIGLRLCRRPRGKNIVVR